MPTQTPAKTFMSKISDLDDKSLSDKCAQVNQGKLLNFVRDSVDGDLVVTLEDGRKFFVRPTMLG